MPATTSFKLSRCWTLSVVQTLMPASSSSSTSCQRLACRGSGSPSARFECASSSTRTIAGARLQRRVEIELAAHDAAVAHLQERQLLEALEQALGLERGRGARRSPTTMSAPPARAARAASSIE